MQDEWKKINLEKMWWIFGFIEFIFVVVCLLSLSGVFTDNKIGVNDYDEQPYIKIENFDVMKLKLDDKEKNVIERLLLDIVNKNTVQVNLKKDTATIRDDANVSINFEKQNLIYNSAILDIPSLGQSYQLFYEYSSDKDNKYLSANSSVMFLCITDKQYIKYPNFSCKDIYGQKTRNTIAAKYIKFFDFGENVVSITGDDYNQVKITNTNNPGSDTSYAKGIVKDRIGSLLISPDLFEY
ncbi:hypothetical protein IKF12_03290 [Candidatus Saccharibacteria bacterium]|nr:hypothetical protein [Candidatus Saccharibacteria bacterium]